MEESGDAVCEVREGGGDVSVEVDDDAVFPMVFFATEGGREDVVFGGEQVLSEHHGEFPVHVDGLEDCSGGAHGKWAMFQRNSGEAGRQLSNRGGF
ncbi:MAG: hypothetical protein RIS92_2669 [Verrucomicrobiota bacterium]